MKVEQSLIELVNHDSEITFNEASVGGSVFSDLIRTPLPVRKCHRLVAL